MRSYKRSRNPKNSKKLNNFQVFFSTLTWVFHLLAKIKAASKCLPTWLFGSREWGRGDLRRLNSVFWMWGVCFEINILQGRNALIAFILHQVSSYVSLVFDRQRLTQQHQLIALCFKWCFSHNLVRQFTMKFLNIVELMFR